MKSICVYLINEQLTVNVFIAHFLKVLIFPVFQFYSVPLVLEVMVGNKSMLQFNVSVERVIYLPS